MLKLLIISFYFIYSASASGEFIILEHPKSLQFEGNDVIDGRDISTVLAASLGFTIQESSDWSGLTIKSPFGLPYVVAVVAVDGVSSLGDFDTVPVFPIDPVEDESRLWRLVQEDVIEHYPMQSNKTLLRVDLGMTSEDISQFSPKFLDVSSEEDESFLQDIAELNSYIESYKENGVSVEDTPVVHWFTMSSLHMLSDVRGSDSDATAEAKKMVRDALIKLGKVVSQASNGRALVAAVVSDASHTRRARDIGSNDTVPENRATEYTESFPAIFNIMLWFAVAFIFSLIAISYFIGTMDPGRDSIIYRMTSNRMKKDS